MQTKGRQRTNLPTRVLITGGAGFIGSHLAEVLLDRGDHVTIIDDLSTGRFENIAHLTEHPNFHFAIETICNEVVMDRLVSECTQIFHLAAAVGVKLIVEKPVHTIETNITGTEAVLKSALRYRAKVLIASTSEVYGKGNVIPFREDDDVVLGPTIRSRWAYAASKMVDEFLALAYYHEKGLPITIFRLFNTVGPRQTGQYGMVIPRFVKQAIADQNLTVYGDGLQTRCFLHVDDAVEAILALSDNQNAIGQVFNIGSTEEISMLELAQIILNLIHGKGDAIDLIPYEEAYVEGFDDMRRRVPDISKMKEFTGWEPKLSLQKTLQDVIAYYDKHRTFLKV
jgi:UDP-glucose 4-epimerase